MGAFFNRPVTTSMRAMVDFVDINRARGISPVGRNEMNKVEVQSYRDLLPSECPPENTEISGERIVWRLVSSSDIGDDAFESSAKTGGKKPLKCDDCHWCGCSVWEFDTPREIITNLTKFPRLSHLKFLAKVKLDPKSGKIKPHNDNPKHLCFWAFKEFDAKSAVIAVSAI